MENGKYITMYKRLKTNETENKWIAKRMNWQFHRDGENKRKKTDRYG